VRANPAFVIIGSCTGGGLNKVLHTALILGSLDADSYFFQIKRLKLGSPL
jgi:hypothetical protein